MSKKSYPNIETIEDKEILGRRAFGKNIFLNESSNHIRMEVFFDNRIENDLSLDRLGVGEAFKKILKKLIPLCEQHQSVISKEFKGWAQLKKEQLKQHQVIPTPIYEPEELKNIYHADLVREKYRDKELAETLAFALAYIASSNDFIKRI